MLIFINSNKDILNRTLQEPVAKPQLPDEDEQTENQLKEPLPRVTSLRESVATAVGVAKHALCQSAEWLRDIDSLLSTENDAK